MEIATKANIDNLQNQITEGSVGGGKVKYYDDASLNRTFVQQTGAGVWTWTMPTSKQEVGLFKIMFASNVVATGIICSKAGLLQTPTYIFKDTTGNFSLVMPDRFQVSYGGSSFNENVCSMIFVSLLQLRILCIFFN